MGNYTQHSLGTHFLYLKMYYLFNLRVGSADDIKVVITETRQQGKIDGHDGIWTLNCVHKEILVD